MKKFILNVIFVAYIVIAVFVTICLLSYNEFKVTEFGNYSLVKITDNTMEPEFNKGDLVIVDKSGTVLPGDKAFFYDTYDRKIEIKLGKVADLEKVNETETTYTFEGERKVSGEYVLGGEMNSSVIPYMGTILDILESKWGFLFLIVLPALLAFFYQITVVVSDIKNSKEKNINENTNNK